MVEQASPIKQTVLDNGLTIISERMDHVRSASVGIWVRSGSRHEAAPLNGISHFIEHTLFKGTRNRTSREIAVESDAIGGHVDAFTSREVASYYVKVLDEHLARAFDLLADLVGPGTTYELARGGRGGRAGTLATCMRGLERAPIALRGRAGADAVRRGRPRGRR